MTKIAPVRQHKGFAQRFEREVRRLQVKLGLLDWSFSFKVEEGDSDAVASATMDRDGRSVVFRVFLSGPTDATPESVALHEVLHVLYTEALDLAAERGNAMHRDVLREEHRAIERLINFIGK